MHQGFCDECFSLLLWASSLTSISSEAINDFTSALERTKDSISRLLIRLDEISFHKEEQVEKIALQVSSSNRPLILDVLGRTSPQL